MNRTWAIISLTFYLWHCVKTVQIWSFFWSVFSRIQIKYSVRMRENIWTRKNSLSEHFSRSVKDSHLCWCHKCSKALKELRNCILCIVPVGSLICSVRVYKSLHFLPILLVKLGFRLCFSFSCFSFFIFVVLHYLLNSMS